MPNCAPGEVRFEEPRDIVRVDVSFKTAAPSRLGVSYLQNTWPKVRLDEMDGDASPSHFGWVRQDDWFNCEWREAKVSISRTSKQKVSIAFQGLASEFSELKEYDVAFRRTLGVRLDGAKHEDLKEIKVFTASDPLRTRLSVELDAGRR